MRARRNVVDRHSIPLSHEPQALHPSSTFPLPPSSTNHDIPAIDTRSQQHHDLSNATLEQPSELNRWPLSKAHCVNDTKTTSLAPDTDEAAVKPEPNDEGNQDTTIAQPVEPNNAISADESTRRGYDKTIGGYRCPDHPFEWYWRVTQRTLREKLSMRKAWLALR
ncbi:hypothetical protein AUEXF2481DRAFT_30711 [Aureobasidium subglaciale EXF-2481]|uniref:Uncharacterized protein n=1 Tax=Aureobasidium subglaciale (strain EXF-2481) TaxID=1043005 RepID=A0A074Z5G5_AURSE|nr:uncharacterized protein AUEXF2481DRAFT_30711 [Aureobasidium subglaciale EXF-2481]KAI5208412.1 hypothetical protein E4T38_02852 [Aureobasidium subglaciale]KAI5227220.1 hypothetical protein E4T40_02710 [Aureobasidium subglaciale]KAI5230592.1 hypothetical protein E4T41_02851 [Aureobasidium subglaciale]KAI5264965.1 hypothetical protein E4T46_02629 [Aureobasidium subglaciale]KEQ94166.1 hypothetical protein AUEXF2481DRAFT_30711 [Aureobasidium subglaciale EXF-2481]